MYISHSFPDIRILFAEAEYQFREPEVLDAVARVTLVRSRPSQQTFVVLVLINDPQLIRAASPDDDYHVNGTRTSVGTSLELLFPPEAENITFSFVLNSDEKIEGVEGFQVLLHTAPGSPMSINASQTIQILDSDCTCKHTVEIQTLILLLQVL